MYRTYKISTANCLLGIYNILVVLEHNKHLHGQTIILLHIIASILLCGMLNITTEKNIVHRKYNSISLRTNDVYLYHGL